RRLKRAADEHLPGADPEQTDGDHGAERLGDRLREERVVAELYHLPRVALTRLDEPALLVRFGAERLHEAHTAHGLLHDAHHLAVVIADALGAFSKLAEERLERADNGGRDDQRQ